MQNPRFRASSQFHLYATSSLRFSPYSALSIAATSSWLPRNLPKCHKYSRYIRKTDVFHVMEG